MKVIFARHGRTNYNDRNLCNGDPSVDVHLTPEGIKQAEALAEKLNQTPLDRIFVSEMRRTQQTADIVNGFHQVSVETDPLLNDHRSGFEGKSADLLEAALAKADDKWTATFNGGESIDDVKQRMVRFIESLKAEPYSTVLVVTSGWLIRLATAVIKDVPNEKAWKTDPRQGDYVEFEI